jgi:hypothetical protein
MALELASELPPGFCASKPSLYRAEMAFDSETLSAETSIEIFSWTSEPTLP